MFPRGGLTLYGASSLLMRGPLSRGVRPLGLSRGFAAAGDSEGAEDGEKPKTKKKKWPERMGPVRLVMRPPGYVEKAHDAEEHHEADEEEHEEHHEGEKEGEEEDHEAGTAPPEGVKDPVRLRTRFPAKAHLQFVLDPFAVHPSQLHPEFAELYYSLYFIMAFAVRNRRNGRYLDYLRKFRVRTSAAEDLPLSVGVPDSLSVGSDGEVRLQNLFLIKNLFLRQSLSKSAEAVDESLARLRDSAATNAGRPELDDQGLHNLYQSLFLSLHHYDQAVFFDRVLPGRRGLQWYSRRLGANPRRATSAEGEESKA
eukprot:RCo006603